VRYAGIRACLWAAISIALFSVNAAAQDRKPIKVDKARVIQHWTKERRANAVPRDLVIDSRGLGYLKRPDGTLTPHGHKVPAEFTPVNQSISPFASRSTNRSGGGRKSSDKTPPTISNLDPAAGTTIGESYTFEAKVTDSGGVTSVTFKIQLVGSTYVNSFPASKAFLSNMWGANFHGFTDGNWQWWVEATDRAGNVASSAVVNFTVYTGTANEPVSHAVWSDGGPVQTAAGRLYFEMPDDQSLSTWSGYVCSATVVNDGGTSGRSLIITAAHCVYDDVNKVFARNAFFVPDQADTTGTRTDGNCNNDPMGCWVPSFGVVDVDWTTRTFPDNIAWDYGFYIIPDTGAHYGTATSSEALDVVAGSLDLSFTQPGFDYTQALGYSYSEDPKLMYCADTLTEEPMYGANWWLDSCGLTGGSSGGPWMQPTNSAPGSGPIVSLNSWGLVLGGQTLPGMAGSKLSGSTASCVFDQAKTATLSGSGSPPDGQAGVPVSCH